jgi:hypothetical protein
MEADITLEELHNTCKEMKDSAPGPDGIPHSVYHKLWNHAGQLIINSWKHSTEKGELCREQKLSTIMLLEKKGKSTTKLNNLRPITLTNCDLKLITKKLGNRMSKITNEIIHKSQTAYIPGRNVHDNLRGIKLIKQLCKEKNERQSGRSSARRQKIL